MNKDSNQNKQLTELSDEELKQVSGGAGVKQVADGGDSAAGVGHGFISPTNPDDLYNKKQ